MSLPSLYSLLDQHFNEEELRTLCFHLGIAYDSLGGRGKAANARELIELLQHQQRLSELLTIVRRLRPKITWPDPPPPLDAAALTAQAAHQEQEQRLFDQVKTLLFPHIWSRDKRESLLSEAFYPAHLWLLEQIDVDGRPVDFLPHCWQALRQGAADGSLNERLLITLRPRYGVQEQQQIDQIIREWRQLCASSAAPFVTQFNQPPRAERGLPNRVTPTLFLSYADADSDLARRLQLDLAAYGYACRSERPSLDKSDERLAATAAGLGNAYAVLLLVGEQTADDSWQRIEYLAALDRHKPIIPLLLNANASLPGYLPPAAESPATELLLAADGLEALLRRLPPSPPPGSYAWLDQAEALRPRLAELLYMDRLKLAELQHVAQYTHLSGHSVVQRAASGRLQLQPVVARQEFDYAPWSREREMPVEQRRFEDAVAELKAIRRAVLLGDPGSGKTTTFYKLAADLIETALADPTAPVPLMVRLGLWTDAAEPFTAFLARSVDELDDGLAQRLADNRVALLLDGINEIPANQQADKYAQVHRFLAQNPNLLAWVSCREQDYPPDRDLRLDRVTVAPLDAVRVQEFIHNYLDALPDFGRAAADSLFWQLAGEKSQGTHSRFMAEVGPKLADPERVFWLDAKLPGDLTWGWREGRNDYWEDWLKERARPASLLLLATNPYMLFMLLQVYQEKRAVPANRGQLFDWFVERLLLRERLFAWDKAAAAVVRQAAGQALLAGLTELAYEMQHRSAANREAGALTALPLSAAAAILNERQRYQAASANLLALGEEVRFTHQLLQEFFVARAMRERIFPGSVGVSPAAGGTPALLARDIWPPRRWWEPTNWEEATILLTGLYSDDCTDVLMWLADAQPELTARCVVESGAHTPEATKLRLREMWLPRLTDLKRDLDARARAAVGRALGRVALEDGTPLDNRPGVGFVLRNGLKIPDIAWGKEIPAGKYAVGGDKEAYDSLEKQTVFIPHAYRLARYPVTYAQFHCFITAPDVADGRWWANIPEAERQWGEQAFPFSNHPRERVSWYQAVAFCRWLSDKLGETVRLPHEVEWEVAARWPDGRIYPWGNQFDSAKGNTREGDTVGQTTAVGIYPQGTNPALALYDLSGNVWEWCRNPYNERNEALDFGEMEINNERRVLRGGSFYLNANYARAAYRDNFTPDDRVSNLGFRLVVVRRSPSHYDH